MTPLPPGSPSLHTDTRPSAGAVAWAWLKPVMIWLLLWVLTLDVVTSPLHAHEHDGVPPPFEAGMVWSVGQMTHVQIHAPDSNHHHAGHPTLALRASDRELTSNSTLPGHHDVNPADAGPAFADWAPTTPRLRAVTLTLPAPPPWSRSPHRCLPPAGRAPPIA